MFTLLHQASTSKDIPRWGYPRHETRNPWDLDGFRCDVYALALAALDPYMNLNVYIYIYNINLDKQKIQSTELNGCPVKDHNYHLQISKAIHNSCEVLHEVLEIPLNLDQLSASFLG